MATASTKPKIHGAMAAILADVKAIAKTDRNAGQGYNFRGIGSVTGTLKPLFEKHGVYVLPTVEASQFGTYTTKGGSVMNTAHLTIRWDFYSAEDGSVVSCTTVGEGADTGDKASNKAMTASQKYALTLSFTIPFEDQDDGDASNPEGREAKSTRPAAPSPKPKPAAKEPERPASVDWKSLKIGVRSEAIFTKPVGNLTWGELIHGIDGRMQPATVGGKRWDWLEKMMGWIDAEKADDAAWSVTREYIVKALKEIQSLG